MKTSHQYPPERHFGLLMGGILLFICAWGVWRHWDPILLAAISGPGVILILAAIIAPRILGPLNRAWYHFGILLGRIVSPIVLGIIFFGLITPVAMIGRLFGRDELRLKPRQQVSYWIKREPPGPPGESFTNQY
jgi:hypothetical protein